jgi:hypothetical protein
MDKVVVDRIQLIDHSIYLKEMMQKQWGSLILFQRQLTKTSQVHKVNFSSILKISLLKQLPNCLTTYTKLQIDYTDKRVIITSTGDKSTYDDFEEMADYMDKNGYGASFCQRILLSEYPIRRAIRKHFEFYLNIVGGMEKIQDYHQEMKHLHSINRQERRKEISKKKKDHEL